MENKRKGMEGPNLFEALTDDFLFMILDHLDRNPLDKKSFSLVCKSFHAVESRHRKTLTLLRPHLLSAVLSRYPSISHLDLTMCPNITDDVLTLISLSLRKLLLSIDLSRSKSFSLAGLIRLVSNCVALVEINLSNETALGNAAAAAIGRAGNLERLWLDRCEMVTDTGMNYIALGCQKLRLLSLRWCWGVSDAGVDMIAAKCKEIRYLDLSNMQITHRCLPAILQLQHLEYLALDGCLCIEDDGLATVKQGCKSLEVLDMSNCRQWSHAGLSSILGGAVGLRQLILTYCSPVTHSLANSLQELSRLQSIQLDGCKITCPGLKAIGSYCISLRELSLRNCVGVADEGLSFVVAKHKELTKIDITFCVSITDVSIAGITSSCTSLTSLRMAACELVSKEGFISIGQHCHLLEELDLTENEIDNEGLKAISRCYKLSSLKIGICWNISDEGLIHVGMFCPKLQVLNLKRSSEITDEGVAAIARGCPMLRKINLAYCTNITDNTLSALLICSKLSTLKIRGCSQVSSPGLLAVVEGCKQITKLDIKKCYKIRDAAMLPLARLSQNLRQIDLSYCSVTDVGLLELDRMSFLQNMTILHYDGITPKGLENALFACGGLKKVKLHSAFESLISKSFIQCMEARGCLFQWKDPLQDEGYINEGEDIHAM